MAIKKEITKKCVQQVINQVKEVLKTDTFKWISENATFEYCEMRAAENLNSPDTILTETIALLIIV